MFIDDYYKDIIYYYCEDKLSLNQIGNKYYVGKSVIKRILTKHKVEIRKFTSKIKNLNINFFKNKSSELYYFWGFILGDGSLIKSGLTITLNQKDNCILKLFCNWLSLDLKNIKYYKNNCRLNIYYKDNFIEYGCVYRKTYNPIIPNIPKKFIKPFLIGLIDADGSVTFSPNKEYSLTLVGNKVIIDWVENKLRALNFTGNINSQLIKNNIRRIRIQRKNDVVNLVKLLGVNDYYHFCLNRKWKNVIDFINEKIIIKDRRVKITHIEKLNIKNNFKKLNNKQISILYKVSITTIQRIRSSK